MHLVLRFTLLLFIAALMGFTIHLVRTKLLQNTQQLGMALVKSYALEEESKLNSFQSALEMVALYVDVLEATDSTDAEVQQWLSRYFDNLSETLGEGSVDPYVVIDGRIIAANPREGDDGFNFSERAWYVDALAMEGQVVFSDVYTDTITGMPVVTVSKALLFQSNRADRPLSPPQIPQFRPPVNPSRLTEWPASQSSRPQARKI